MNRPIIYAVAAVIGIFLAACSQNPPTPTREPGVRALAIDPRDGRLFKAASDGLFLSRDDGKIWQPITLPREIAANAISIVALRLDQPDMLFIAGEQIGVWRSSDAAKTWQKKTRGLASDRVSAIALHSNGYQRDSSNSLFAWVDGIGIFESDDAGDTWKRSVDQAVGLEGLSVTALTHSPLEGSMNRGWLYASTPTGAYISMDCY